MVNKAYGITTSTILIILLIVGIIFLFFGSNINSEKNNSLNRPTPNKNFYEKPSITNSLKYQISIVGVKEDISNINLMEIDSIDDNEEILNKDVIVPNNTKSFHPIANVSPGSFLSLDMDDIKSQYTTLLIFLNKRLFSTIDTEKITDSLNIGQVSSALLYFESPVIFGGGSHEIKQLWINNNTSIPLSFNNHINVPPNSMIRYEGTGSFAPSGISIGTILKNDQNIFDDFILDENINMIWYGLNGEDKPKYMGSRYATDSDFS